MHRSMIVATGSVFGLCSAGQAALFGAVSVSPSPDTLITFDTSDPAGANVGSPLELAGNFIRGLELTGADTGWYVATDDIGGSPTGFFRLDKGTSSMVAPMPFLSTTTGGVTFSQDESFLYWSSVPSGQDDTLYRIDFDGTFTELAEVTLAGAASVQLAGLAVHPTTGVLYGLENTSDSLVTIDPETGIATMVGPGLGISASAVGGMDFTSSGELFIATAFGDVFEVDPMTGLAGPLLGELPFNTSAIAFIPAPGVLALLGLAGVAGRRRRRC